MDPETRSADACPSIRPPRKLYRIGEIMSHTGISRQTLHNYTVRGLITEAERTAGNHRLYDEAVFERLEAIRRLKGKRTLAEIRRLLAGDEGNGRTADGLPGALRLQATGA